MSVLSALTKETYRSRKFILTLYSVLLSPALLAFQLIGPDQFVMLYNATLALYFGANVFQKRGEKNDDSKSTDQ